MGNRRSFPGAADLRVDAGSRRREADAREDPGDPTAHKSLRPLLVIVRGKPGSGKTTLAHRLAEPDALGLPLLDRDAIKAGLVETHGVETDELRATIVPRSFDLFFRTIADWLRAGVSLIAEHSFRRDLHEANLRALIPLARAVVITCETSDEEARRRYLARERSQRRTRPDLLAATAEGMERGLYHWRAFDAYDLGVPALTVDTTRGYAPDLAAIVAFCRRRGGVSASEEHAPDTEERHRHTIGSRAEE